MSRSHVRIHPTAEVADSAELGEGTSIWNQAQVRERARLGRGVIVGKDAYVDFEVTVGDHSKIQNGALLYHGLEVGRGVFIGPGVIFTNDREPRAVNADGSPKGASDWTVGRTVVEEGASVGAGSIVVTGVRIGRFAMIGAGSVVTRDVAPFALVYGNPARVRGVVCFCGRRVEHEPGERCACPPR